MTSHKYIWKVDNMQYAFSLTAIIKGWLAQMISDNIFHESKDMNYFEDL